MHDIDAKIAQISGQQDYMAQLQKVTGDITQINKDMFKAAIERCSKCDSNLEIIADRFINTKLLDAQSLEMFTEFKNLRKQYDIANKTFIMETRKSKKSNKPPREIIDSKHRPIEIVASPWFKQVRSIEEVSRKYLDLILGTGQYDSDDIKVEQFHNAFKENPDLETISIFCGITIKPDDDKLLASIALSNRFARIIINTMMEPMYDVKKTIIKNYHIINKVFKATSQRIDGINSTEDVINILHKFICAKYRVMLTGNNEHYIKLFSSLVDDANSVDMDGAKFLNIMDSLNLEQLDKNNNTYKFAVGAKDIINKIIRNEELDAEEIVERINDILNPKEEPKEVPAHEDAKQFDNLL